MIIHQAALFLGLFAAPAALLVLGHGFRRRSAREHRVFWGGVIGFAAGTALMVGFGTFPPVGWGAEPSLRLWIVYWAPVVLTSLGAVVASMRRPNSPEAP
jgi:hypothetical protein